MEKHFQQGCGDRPGKYCEDILQITENITECYDKSLTGKDCSITQLKIYHPGSRITIFSLTLRDVKQWSVKVLQGLHGQIFKIYFNSVFVTSVATYILDNLASYLGNCYKTKLMHYHCLCIPEQYTVVMFSLWMNQWFWKNWWSEWIKDSKTLLNESVNELLNKFVLMILLTPPGITM